MHNQPHPFNDVQGMPWTLTALAMSGTHFALESTDAAICIVAQKAILTLDETHHESPFVLELDANTSIHIDAPTMEKLNQFLQTVAA